jgi:hypothetical protein
MSEKIHCKEGEKQHNPLSDIFKGGFMVVGMGLLL